MLEIWKSYLCICFKIKYIFFELYFECRLSVSLKGFYN